MKQGGILLSTLFLAITIFMLVSCKEALITDYPPLKDGSEIPADLDSVRLNYDSFFQVKYGLDYPFLKIKNNFYFFETYFLQLFKYNLIDSTWQSNFSYSTNEYISTNKYYFADGDSVVMVSYYESSKSLDLYSINSLTLTLRLLKKNLVLGESLSTGFQSTFLWDKDRLIILLHPANKILTVDMKNFTIKTTSDSHLSDIRHDASFNSSTITGTVGRDIYLYYYSYKKMFRFNLDTYNFTEIPVPKFLSIRMNNIWDRGAVVSNYFCFWPSDSYFTLCYDVIRNIWVKGGQNPFYQKWYMPLNYTSEENSSYYQDNSIMKRISVK
ncbi:MAG: hypothetical protein CVV24_06905 [Ignavibacteriae bacterium HGW-Ignavibacteriae-3]|nr:MAG: hypothetical protein CVV24_06905 [Ignavibacteriae bacterium HGW-Ignavibacteriae-3]